LTTSSYVINLDSREDRRNEFFSQTDLIGVKVERISAVHAEATKNSHSTPPGVAACWLSHQKALLRFLETDHNFALIFEDDAIFTTRAARFILEFDSYSKPEFDVLQIGYLDKRGKLDSGARDLHSHLRARINHLLQKIRVSLDSKIHKVGSELLIPDSFEAGTHAYICSRTMAQRLVKFNVPVVLAADLAFIQIARSKKYKYFRLSRSLIGQSDSVSSIHLRQTT